MNNFRIPRLILSLICLISCCSGSTNVHPISAQETSKVESNGSIAKRQLYEHIQINGNVGEGREAAPDDGLESNDDTKENHGHGIHLASWRWIEYSNSLMFTGMIISAVVIKIIFHHLKSLSKVLPESCVLILVGIVAAVFIKYVLLDEIIDDEDSNLASAFPTFTADLFFNVLLPPIILDAALALYDRDFFNNVSSVLVFAVFGTLFNVFAIGFTLFGLTSCGALGELVVSYRELNETHIQHKDLGPIECLIFSSLISAVDPVAVLAIFEDLQVNMGLYFLVFGESLLNDGVTVVLYNSMNSLLEVANIGVTEIFMALLSFLFVVFGGFVIGFMCGLFSSYVTTWTKNVQVVEPLVIFSTAYFAFLSAELFHWSGIISIIGYGITIKRYGFNNLAQNSYTTVKYAIKTIASTSDCIIFLFLGVVLIQEEHYWHPGFIIATIITCLIYRFISTFLFSWICNLRRTHRITKQEQFIMAYGGLRGAVGFSLAVVLSKNVWYRELFVSTALAMVFFTVFLQGGTMKLMVKLFNITLNQSDKEHLITVDIQEKVIDDIMEGIETVIGKRKDVGCIISALRRIDHQLKNWLILADSKLQLTRKFEKIILEEHFTNLYAPRVLVEDTEQTDAAVKVPTQETSLDLDRKHFKDGLRSSQWKKYRNKFDTEVQSDEREIIRHLEMRVKRTKSMESKVLEKQSRELYTKNEEVQRSASHAADRKHVSVDRKPLARANTLGVGWKAVQRVGGTAAIIKSAYDQTQEEKSSLLEGSLPNSPNRKQPNITFTEEDENEESHHLLSTNANVGNTKL